MSIKDEILRYRALKNLSQLDFARKAGVSKGTICGIEAGTQEPTQRTIMKIRMCIEEAQEVQK